MAKSKSSLCYCLSVTSPLKRAERILSNRCTIFNILNIIIAMARRPVFFLILTMTFRKPITHYQSGARCEFYSSVGNLTKYFVYISLLIVCILSILY